MASVALNGLEVFGDKVYSSTDLNRRSGEVLNHAREHPVTISRNNEQFALLRREQAAKLVRTVSRINSVFELLSEAHEAMYGGNPCIGWLKVFDRDDLQKLSSEILIAARNASKGQSEWREVDALIHEWRESALVAKTGVLDAAMSNDESDETSLPHPDEVVKPAEKEAEEECQTKG